VILDGNMVRVLINTPSPSKGEGWG